MKWERCPMCGRCFEDCPHSVAAVEDWLQKRQVVKLIENTVRKMARADERWRKEDKQRG